MNGAAVWRPWAVWSLWHAVPPHRALARSSNGAATYAFHANGRETGLISSLH